MDEEENNQQQPSGPNWFRRNIPNIPIPMPGIPFFRPGQLPESYSRRRDEGGQSRRSAALGALGEAVAGPIPRAWSWLNEPNRREEFIIPDPTAAYEDIVTRREQAAMKAAEQDYNRRMAGFTGTYSPMAERQMQAAQEAWNRALGSIAAEQGAIGGLAAQSGRDYRTMGTDVNVAAQRALTGRGSIPATGVAGMGGVTGVQAADLAAQTGQRANAEAAARQAALGGRAGQLGSLQQLIAGQAAASQQQMAAMNLAREQAARAAFNEQLIAEQRAARQAATAGRADFEMHQALVTTQTPFWKREWRNLSKDEKKRLEREEGIKTEDQYLIMKSAEAWALGQMAQG